ncbi:MAG TPA: MFS transporter [Pseudonocardiaceae bacterium]|nr:MFS transporter [Pseudonocardiaceae bacterium]
MAELTEHSYRQVLRDRRLAVLLGGDLVSSVGDGMAVVALPLLALRVRGGVDPALAIALISAAPYVVAVALSLLFGLGRRRFRPRQVLVVDCTTRFVVLTGVALLALTDMLPLWTLGVALLVGSGLRLLALSSRRLVATELAGERGRFAVNGLLGTGDSLATYVIGPALGGVLATAISPGFVLLLDGASFLGLLVVTVAVVPAIIGRATDPTATPTSGWAILRRVPVVAWLLVIVFCFDLFYMPLEVALPLLVKGPLRATGTALGVIWTAFGVGALCGSLVTSLLRRLPRIALLVSLIGGWGGTVVLLGFAPTTTAAAGMFALGGLIYAPFTPIMYTFVQSKLRHDHQQPVLTLWSACVAVAAPVGLLLAGPLVALTDSRASIVISGVLTLVLVPGAARSLRAARRSSRSRL